MVILERRVWRSVLHTKNGLQIKDGGDGRDLKNGWMSWVWPAVILRWNRESER
jgi:hypothetical protein